MQDSSNTNLELEYMSAIIGLDEDDLVFVVIVQWMAGVLLDGEVEYCCSCLEFVEQGCVVHAVVRRDELCATEAVLCGSASRYEY